MREIFDALNTTKTTLTFYWDTHTESSTVGGRRKSLVRPLECTYESSLKLPLPVSLISMINIVVLELAIVLARFLLNNAVSIVWAAQP